jgi:glycosyltransferase involved in cell wall biosynthesis
MISLNPKPVILTIFESYEYQILMGDIDAVFMVYQCNGSKKITRALPSNHQVIYDVTPNIRPDILLSQNKINQYGIFTGLAKKYNKPLISLYHNLPAPKDADRVFGAKSNDDVFLSDDHAKGWGFKEATIIPPTTNRIITKISEPLLHINKSDSFSCLYNTLDYMAAGNCIISPAIYELNNIIKHGYNGFLYKKENPEKEKEIIQKLTYNDDLIMEMGANSQKTISERFSKLAFTDSWNSLIRKYV